MNCQFSILQRGIKYDKLIESIIEFQIVEGRKLSTAERIISLGKSDVDFSLKFHEKCREMRIKVMARKQTP